MTFVALANVTAAPKVSTQLPNKTLDSLDSRIIPGGKNNETPLIAKPDRPWAFYLQYYSGTALEKEESYNQFHYGTQFSMRPIDLRASIGTGTAAFSISKISPLLSSISLSNGVEPIYRYGLDWMLKTSDGLGSFANTKRLQLFGAVGLNDLTGTDRRFSVEVGIGLSLTGVTCNALFGVHF